MAYVSRAVRPAAFLARFRAATVETSSGLRLRVKGVDRKTVEVLRAAHRAGLHASAALPFLLGLLVEDGRGRPLRATTLERLPTSDQGRLLSAVMKKNAAIFGVATMRKATDPAELPVAPAARLGEIARTFIDSYLAVDEMVGAQIITALRSSSA